MCAIPAPWANAEMLRLDGEEEDPACSQSAATHQPPSTSISQMTDLESDWLPAQETSRHETLTAAAAAKVPVITIKTLDIQLVSGVSAMRHDGKKVSNINKNR